MTDKPAPNPFKATLDAAASGQRFSRGITDSAQQIWLAGLGALARTQQEGGRFFDALVEEGVRVQEKTHAYTQEQMQHVRGQVEPWVDAARKRTAEAMGKLEQAFDARTTRALQRMNIPTRSDFEKLAAQIESLAREVQASRARPQAQPRKATAARRTRTKPKPGA